MAAAATNAEAVMAVAEADGKVANRCRRATLCDDFVTASYCYGVRPLLASTVGE